MKEESEVPTRQRGQAFIDIGLGDLSDLMTRTQVTDPSTYEHDRVRFGSTVTLEDLDTEEEVTYTIVGSTESNPDIGLISYHSPLAKQLLGKPRAMR